MMTKKKEMAEWILDFFRREKVDAGQVVMMRSIQNKIYDLSSKERDMFVPVVNELIDNGYFVYEEGSPQVFRLTEKGRDYIYGGPNAELDCCNDAQSLTPIQIKYISNWHDSFVFYINQLKTYVAGWLTNPSVVTEGDKRGLELCNQILNGEDVRDVERSLGAGVVNKEVLDKIEKFHKDLANVILDNIQADAIFREFLRNLSIFKIEQERKSEEFRLSVLRIPME